PLWISHESIRDLGSSIERVHCGLGFTYLLTEQGGLYVFGKATNGQLGLGSDTRSSKIAVPIENIYEKVQSVSCGVHTSLAVTASGDVYQWGIFLLWDADAQ
ncbi:myosin h, partial [Cystoisospora suis]